MNAKELLSKFKAGTCTAEELRLIEKWALNYRAGQPSDLTEDDLEEAGADIWNSIQQNRVKQYPVLGRFRYRIVAAASVLLCLSTGIFFLIKKRSNRIIATQVVVSHNPKKEILPGGNKAVLTLANGKTIVLTGAQNGHLAKQGNINITKAADGQIIYHADKQATGTASIEMVYNTVATPRGGQYQIVLPDGSHVWLNAATSLKYPTAFSGKSREVELNGEAYFEIAKDPNKPFRVNTGNKQQVEVLGTHFNVEGYAEDEGIKTTLLEGSVKLIYGKKQTLLLPGQMAINNLANQVIIKQANIDAVMAWKNGLFFFNDENIKDVMKKASRWYDFDVEYRGNVEKKKFGGIVSRYKNVTELLDNINLSSGIKYSIEGRRVILMK